MDVPLPSMNTFKRVIDRKTNGNQSGLGGGVMTGKAFKTFGTAVMQRMSGDGPGRMRAAAASVVAGAAVGGATYKLLRSSGH
jgi:hypothetical protein